MVMIITIVLCALNEKSRLIVSCIEIDSLHRFFANIMTHLCMK